MATKTRIVSDGALDASEDIPGDRGRRIEAQLSLSIGELVLRASSRAVVLLPELWGSHCHQCFAPGGPLSQCGRCHTARYCSKTCQQADWVPDHRKECKRLARFLPLGLRSDQVAEVLLLGRILRRKDREGLLPLALVWDDNDMDDRELQLLAALAQKIHLVDGKKLAAMQRGCASPNRTVVLTSISLDTGNGASAQPLSPQQLFRLRRLVAGSWTRLLSAWGDDQPQLRSKLRYHVRELLCCIVTERFMVSKSTVNTGRFVPKTLEMEVRAMKRIEAGEEITQTYIDVALPRRERHQQLRQKYHFTCHCIRCSQPLQAFGSLDSCLDADVDGIPQELWTEQRQHEVEQALKEVRDVTTRFASEIECKTQQQQRIHALQKLADQQSTVLHRDNIARLRTLATLFSAEMERGSTEEAIGYGERMLRFYRRIYHSNHPMTGLHLFTLGDLYGQQVQSGSFGSKTEERKTKAREYLAEAQRILRITHGKNHRFVMMLEERLEKMSSR